MKKYSLIITTIAIIIIAAVAFTQKAQNNAAGNMTPKSIPQLETERLARETNINRDDTGRLTNAELDKEHQAISTRSTIFVMENVQANNLSLPITGERAKIAFFSASDNQLDVQVSDPTGNALPLAPQSLNNEISNEVSKVMAGRSNRPEDGVLLLSDRPLTTPGQYAVNVRQSKSPIDIIVNDEGGPELNLWLSDDGRDSSQSVTLYAKLADGQSNILGAQLKAKLRGAKDRSITLTENEPGIYSATLNTAKLSGISTFIVEAKGNTARGFQLLRHGSIDLISGQAHAQLLGIGKEELNDTDLVVEVKINVTAPGRYYVRGNLLGSNDEPIAWAQDAREFTAGPQTLTLRFARELINQSGISAGFKLADVELMNTTDMPGIKASNKISDYFLKSSL